MEYTKESLKMWWEPTMYLPWLQPYLIKFASAWAREVVEMEMDKEELRWICKFLDEHSNGFDDDVNDSLFKQLWAKHMEGGEGLND